MAALEAEIAKLLVRFDQDELLTRLQTIPGVGLRVAQVIIAEVGTDLSRFQSAAHLAAWAGLVPGKHESAGRNYSGKTNKANRYLKAMLVQAAQSVGHTRDNYLAAQFHRLAARRGKKRAAVAVAHSILVIAYHLIRRGTAYVDLGAAYFDQRKATTVQNHLVKRLQRLGFTVTLEPSPETA